MTVKIDVLLSNSEHSVDACVVFVLLWVAASDGDLKPEKRTFIQEKLPAAGDGIDTAALLDIISSGDVESFTRVFSILTKQLSGEEKNFLLELAIGVAVADEQLSISENHILRFLADLLGFDGLRLKVLFKIISGKDLQEPDDPSSKLWWEKYEENSTNSHDVGKRTSHQITREDACVLLGIAENASTAEIKKAYKRRMQSYHPDRYESLGADAKKIAQQTFIRIREAYEVLMQ